MPYLEPPTTLPVQPAPAVLTGTETHVTCRGVFVGSERDGNGQPTHLRIMRSNGSHVAQSDADWVWHLLQTHPDANPW